MIRSAPLSAVLFAVRRNDDLPASQAVSRLLRLREREALRRRVSALLVEQTIRNLAAILGQLLHDFFVQPDVHGSRVVLVATVMQVGS